METTTAGIYFAMKLKIKSESCVGCENHDIITHKCDGDIHLFTKTNV